ncbi:MAG: hypothetical protein IJP84_02050 [Lachnospiraceae bacterium]|nr:hypothetical protein [Lachnospiraceae bacterium]
MEFELWLYAVKQLAQNYEMSQVIFSQLTKAEQDDLRKEYESTIGGGEKKKENQALKDYKDLIGGLQNAMSITERYVEKNSIKKVNDKHPIDESSADEEFLKRTFLAAEKDIIKAISILSHVSKSVSAEGELKKNDNGTYSLNDTVISDGMLLEFFYMNRWELGKLCNLPGSAYGCIFLGMHGETFDVNLEGLKVRLRS